MKKTAHLRKRITLFAIAAIAAGSFEAPIFAVGTTSTANQNREASTELPNNLQPGTLQLAQLTGTCRRINRAAPVYESAATTSTIVANLPGGSIVRLAANTGSNGLIQINSPANGFIETRNLSPQVPCPGTDPNQPGDLTGTCRRLNYTAPVRKEASFTSPVVTTLTVGTVVRLAAKGGTNGFILINSPNNGYVEARNLSPQVPCPGGQTPPGDRCRQVLNPPEGLVIRREPNTGSAIVGGVAQGARVTLTANPPTRRTDAAGRIWIEIESPNRGWVSNGFPNNPSNLIFCR